MASLAHQPDENARKRRRLFGRLAVSWLFAMSALFLWQVASYGWMIDWAAEWQFAALGTYFPSLTFIAALSVAALPVAIYLLLRWREARRATGIDAGGGRSIGTATRWMRIFFGMAGMAIAAAFYVLVTMPSQPGESGSVQRVNTSLSENQAIAEGRSEFTGEPDYGLIASYGQNLLVLNEQTWFAPVSYARERGRVARFFVELKRLPGKPARFSAPGVGFLQRNALPGEIASLYRGSGVAVADTHFVLFQSERFQRWRHLVLAAQLALAGAVFLIFGLLQRRRRNKVRDQLKDAREQG